MGTNYYLHEKPPCPMCGRAFDALHIGKSSAGWCFSLHVIPEEGINDLADWQARWSRPGAEIYNEYGGQVGRTAMFREITQRSWPHKEERPEQWYRENGAEPGPDGLARHKAGVYSCIGNGAGTWDLLVGEFS